MVKINERVYGPNERYARWNEMSGVGFDRWSGDDNKDAKRYVLAQDYHLSQHSHARDFFEFLPAEPFFPLLAEIIRKKKNHMFTPAQYGNIRLHLLKHRLINYAWTDFIQYDGKVYKSTPYFLTVLGKYYYNKTFSASPDTMAKGFYRDRIISNRDCSIRHIYHVSNFYKKQGHDVVIGKYPFDIIVDNKHGFLLTEMHENSIGIEMRLSEAMYRGMNEDINLYFPTMTSEHRRRICGIIGGLLFEHQLPAFTYASYLEPEICSDVSINNWSYFVSNSVDHGRADIFQDPLPFPKISMDSHKIVGTQLTAKPGKVISRNKISFTHSLRFINGLNNKELLPGIRVTAGYGPLRTLWQELASGADILITGKIRSVLLDNLHGNFPKVIISDELDSLESKDEEDDHLIEEAEDIITGTKNVYSALRRKNVELIPLQRNHAKAVLNGYRLLVHSMPTTHYMGNNQESFGLIDFTDHPQRNKINKSLSKMLMAFGRNDPKNFIEPMKYIRKIFMDKIGIFAHFSGTRTVDWIYYRQLAAFGRNKDLKMLTSHVDMVDLTKKCSLIKIQGVSRLANHLSLMDAKCPVIKERMWHPRMIYNDDFVALGSWDFAQITDQKELQLIIKTTDKWL